MIDMLLIPLFLPSPLISSELVYHTEVPGAQDHGDGGAGARSTGRV